MINDPKFPPFFEETLKSLNMPSANMEALIDVYKKNIDLLNATQQIAIEATNTIMELQRKHIEKVMADWNEQVTSTNPSDVRPEDTAEATKDKLNETLDHINEVNAVVEKSNKKIKDSFQKRLKESIDEVAELRKKK